MRPLLLIDVVGLTPRAVREHAPAIADIGRAGALAPMNGVLPAVTCSAQATMLTGTAPQVHGAVGNGWFDRANGDVALWRQSNALVEGPKLYERARERDPAFTCAKIFWWWNMGAAVDWSITPRPFYPADGRKIIATYGQPVSYDAELARELGPFPFFDFWGPKSGLPSSRWIADAAIRTLEQQRPTLTLVYLPHLDYSHQRFGPADPRSLAAIGEIDRVVSDLRRAADARDVDVMIVSEYGIEPVERPVHINRALREEGLLAVRETPVGEVLDTFASSAFAVADHQLAHVYVRDDQARERAQRVLGSLAGVGSCWSGRARSEIGLDHPRAGDIVALCEPGAWFTYYYWLDERKAPDFAPTVDIHRKPGYDPCELFLDPRLAFPKLRVARRLAQKKLGMRYLMDVIPIDPSLVRGSHGRPPAHADDGPVFLSSRPFAECGGEPGAGVVEMVSVAERALVSIFG